MNVETHNEAGRCRHKGCRVSRLAARQLCQRHYDYHKRRGTLEHFPATLRPRQLNAAHVCEHAPAARCYWNHGCRCRDCREDANRRRAVWIARRATGRARTVPAATLLPHLREQFARPGVTKAQCAADTGLSYYLILDFTNGRVQNVTPQVATILSQWYGQGWCESCGRGTPAYGTGRWCLDCLNHQRQKHAA